MHEPYFLETICLAKHDLYFKYINFLIITSIMFQPAPYTIRVPQVLVERKEKEDQLAITESRARTD